MFYQNKSILRSISVFSVIMLFFTLLPPLSLPASAAETVGIRAGEYYYLRNYTSHNYLDFDYQTPTYTYRSYDRSFNGQSSQGWRFIHLGNGVYKLRSCYNNGITRALDASGSYPRAIEDSTSSAYQKFTLIRRSSGTYQIKYGNYYLKGANSNGWVSLTTTSSNETCWSLEKIGHGDAFAYTCSKAGSYTAGGTASFINSVQTVMQYDGEVYNYHTAEEAFSEIKTCDIWIFNTSGDRSILNFLHSSTGIINGRIRVTDPQGVYPINPSTDYNLASLADNALCSERLVMFLGQYNGYSFPEAAFAKGAHCSLGFIDVPTYSQRGEWMAKFFEFALKRDATVIDSAEYTNVIIFGSGHNFSYNIVGDKYQQLSH